MNRVDKAVMDRLVCYVNISCHAYGSRERVNTGRTSKDDNSRDIGSCILMFLSLKELFGGYLVDI